MAGALNNRLDATTQIQRLVAEDVWTARYGLLKALSLLDLGGVNEVLQWLEDAVTEGGTADPAYLAKLNKERWS